MRSLKWLLPLLAFILLAPFTPFIDLYIARLFYNVETETFYNNGLFQWLFLYGEWFAFVSAGIGCIVWLLSYFFKRYKKWRSASMTVVLTLVIGAGVLTNLGFKGHWGRPRPKQITEFGGKCEYRPFWQPKFGLSHADAQKSFPSGHAAMGFYFLSIILVGKRYRNRPLLCIGWITTVGLGIGLMVIRVTQGGHFFSDVCASLLLMWCVALVIDRLTSGVGASTNSSLYSDDSIVTPNPSEEV